MEVKAGTEAREETDRVKPVEFGLAGKEKEEKNVFAGFGIKQTDTDLKPFGAVTSNFGSSTGASGFSFGFLNQKKEESPSQEEQEEAPKAEKVEPVAEEDSLYSKKCKLFYKKEVA